MIAVATIKLAAGIRHDRLDSLIEDEIEPGAVAFVGQQTGKYWGEPGETTEYIWGSGTRGLYLGAAPIVAEMTPLTIVEHDTPGDDGTEIDAADYVVRGAQVIRTTGVFARSTEYEVAYTRGYTAGQEPADIRSAVLVLAVAALRSIDKQGTASESVSGYSYTAADWQHLDPVMRRTLLAYRRPRL